MCEGLPTEHSLISECAISSVPTLAKDGANWLGIENGGFDILQVHISPTFDLNALPALFNELEACVAAGLCQHYGVSTTRFTAAVATAGALPARILF